MSDRPLGLWAYDENSVISATLISFCAGDMHVLHDGVDITDKVSVWYSYDVVDTDLDSPTAGCRGRCSLRIKGIKDAAPREAPILFRCYIQSLDNETFKPDIQMPKVDIPAQNIEIKSLIGTKVILKSFIHEGAFPGEIVSVAPAMCHDGRPICRVKLECQEESVGRVLYYDSEPTEVRSSLWQICYPITE